MSRRTLKAAALLTALLTAAAPPHAAFGGPALSGRLRVTAEIANATDRPTPVGRFMVQVDCNPGLRTRLILTSPAAPTRVIPIPKGARCRIAVRRQPLAPYPCEWETAYSPADHVGEDGDRLTVRITLICRSGQ